MPWWKVPNAVTWTATFLEVAVGAWMVISLDWPLVGGIAIGLAMGAQFSRITNALLISRKM